MKKKNLLALFALFVSVALLIAGCSNIGDATVAGGGDGSDEPSYATLTVNNIDAKKLEKAYSSRTVVPTPFNVASAGLTWKVKGSSTRGGSLSETAITVTADETDTTNTTGTAALALSDSSIWTLTLTAYNSDSKPVLIGYATADLRSGSAAIVFNMGVKGLTTPGGITITPTASYVDADKIAKAAVFELYDMQTGDVKYTGETLSVPLASATASPYAFVSANTAFKSGESTEIAPGEYLLGINFYSDAAATTNIGFWSDLIVIAPGVNTEFKETYIKGIKQLPTAPTGFGAQLVKDSEKNSMYNVKFTWTDTSDTETNFEIGIFELAEASKDAEFAVTDANTIEQATDWSGTKGKLVKVLGLNAVNAKATDYTSSSYYVNETGSSLFAGSTSVTLKLDTGKQYEFMIRSRNATGASAWVARSAVASPDTGNTAYAIGTKHVNRVKLTYNFKTNDLYYQSGETAPTSALAKNTYTTYAIYEGDSIYLMGYSTTNTTSPKDIVTYTTLAQGKYAFVPTGTTTNKTFKQWSEKEGDTTVANAVISTTYLNKLVFAIFDNSTTIKTYTYSNLDTTKTAITVTGSTSNAVTASGSGTVKEYTLASTDTTVKIKLAETTTPTYSMYRFRINGSIDWESSDSTKTEYELTTSYYDAGDWSCSYEAYNRDDDVWYSYPFILTIKH